MKSIREELAISDFKSSREDFYRDLGDALKNKSDLLSEFVYMLGVAEKRGQIGRVQMFKRWIKNLDSGLLTETIKNDVPKSDVMILGAFEQSGRLADGLEFLSMVVTKSKNMKSTIINAMAGPMLVACMLFGILGLHGYLITPTLEQIYPVEEWPALGQALYPVATFIKNSGIYAGIAIVMFFVAFALSINRWTGPYRKVLDNYLPYSVFRDYNGALFLISLASLMKAGNGVAESMEKLSKISSPWMKWHIELMLKNLDKNADAPAKALDTGCIRQDLMDRIISYGNRSSFLQAMNVIGVDSIDRTERALNKNTAVMQTIMLLVVGIVFAMVIGGTLMTGMHAESVLKAKTM